MILIAFAAAAAPVTAPAETPRHFVERVYAGYRDADFSPLKHPEQVFAPPLVAAIREEARQSRGEVGFMDADPLCDCQDPAGMRPSVTEAAQTGSAAARVRVALRFGDDSRRLALMLVRTAAGWRIADISGPDEPSLLADLSAWNRKHRKR